MSLKLFKFSVENTVTGESCAFLGQGETVADAFKEGSANTSALFRPSTSGAKRPEHGVAVTTKDGRKVSRTLKEFESDQPYTGESES